MDTSQIKEHMKVVGADGRAVGTVDRVENNQIKLAKSDQPDGQHHYVDIRDVAEIRSSEVCLSKKAQIH